MCATNTLSEYRHENLFAVVTLINRQTTIVSFNKETLLEVPTRRSILLSIHCFLPRDCATLLDQLCRLRKRPDQINK